MPRPATVLLAAAALLAAGCGADRVEAPDISRPFATQPPVERTFPAAGIRFRAPADLVFAPGDPPLVATTSTGTATVAIWRYARTEPLPRDDAALADAADALRAAARVRDPSLRIERIRRVEVDGAPALQVVGRQRILGRPRRVRSTHVYAKEAELVVDQYAAPRDFRAADRGLFRPLLRSLKVDPPAA